MEPLIIDSKFSRSVLAAGIAKASAASKNSLSNKNHFLGYRAEYNVVLLMQSRGWNLAFHRFKTVVAEIDLIFEKKDQVILVEVKKLNNDWRAFERISAGQLLRLRSNLLLFSQNFRVYKIEAFVAWVDVNNKVSFCRI